MARSIAGSARLRRLADLTGPIRRARKIFRAAGALPSAQRFGTQPSRIIIRLPASILLELLKLVSSGHGFKVIPVEAELTTQQAADILSSSTGKKSRTSTNGDIVAFALTTSSRTRRSETRSAPRPCASS